MTELREIRKVFYEWDIETCDGEDIIDHNHDDVCPGIPSDPAEKLVLVRDVTDPNEGVIDRQWAYVTDGVLPDHFLDAGDRPQSKVPRRFQKELMSAIARTAANA